MSQERACPKNRRRRKRRSRTRRTTKMRKMRMRKMAMPGHADDDESSATGFERWS